MSMCQDIVFNGQAKGKERAHDSSDSGESEINWQLEALNLGDDSDDEDNEDDAREPAFGNEDIIPVFYDDIDNFNDGMAEESCVAGPSSVPQPTQSSLLMPATPQRAHPEPQLVQPPKPRPKARKVSDSTTPRGDILLPLPPPATPRKSTLSITLDSDFLSDASHNPFETSLPKKAQAKRRSDMPAIGSLTVSLARVVPTDDDEERGKLLIYLHKIC